MPLMSSADSCTWGWVVIGSSSVHVLMPMAMAPVINMLTVNTRPA